MIWHIFRKDCRLLWRPAIGVTLIHAMDRVILSSAGIFRNATVSPQVLVSGLLGIVSLLAAAVLIVMVVQQDSILGVRQDWLVRPIRRRDLMLSKILFVALIVQGPIFVIEVVQCLAAGFPLGSSLAAPLTRSLWMLLAMDLPVLAFATLTRNLTQAAVSAIVVVLGYALFTQFTVLYLNSIPDQTWVGNLGQVAWGLAGVAAVLTLQYYRRKITRARWAYGAAVLGWLVLQFQPWQAAFAIEERLSAQPAAATVRIVFDPAFGKLPGPAPRRTHARGLPTADVALYVPTRIVGLGEGQMLAPDRVSVRIVRNGGPEIGLADEPGSLFISAGEVRGHEIVWIPQEVYNRLKDQPVSLEIEYSLRLLQASQAYALPVGGDQWIEGVGRCATRIHEGAQVELGCLAPGHPPCATWTLEDKRSGEQTVHRTGCEADDSPYVGHVVGDSISRLAREFPLMNSQQLSAAQLVVKVYRPEAHFTSQVLIRDTRLSDWRPE
jgi:hypothetical protein